MLVEKEYIKQFLLGGKCEGLIRNIKSGNSFTYKITLANNSEDLFFIHVKEASQYIYAGQLRVGLNNIYAYKQGVKGAMSERDLSIVALLYVLKNHSVLTDVIEVWHFGKCSKCGRKLTDTKSISRGLGPDCAKRVKR